MPKPNPDRPRKPYQPSPTILRPKKAKGELASALVDDFEFARDGRLAREDHWLTYWKIYLSEERRARVAGRSNSVGPHGGLTIRQLVPIIKKAVMSTRPFIRTKSRKRELAQMTPLIDNLFDYWVETAHIKSIVLTHMLKEGLIFGAAWGVVDHIMRTRPVPMPDIDEETGEQVGIVIVPEPLYEGPWVWGVPTEDAFPYPNARSMDELADSGYFVRRFFRTKSELLEDPLYEYDAVESIGATQGRGDLSVHAGLPLDKLFENERRRVLGMDIEEFGTRIRAARAHGDEIVECLELISNGQLLTVANRELLIRDDTLDHPFPVFSICPDPIPNEIFGKSCFHDARSSIDQRDFGMNNIFDNAARLVHQMFKGIPGQYNPDTLLPRPGGVVQVRSMDGLVELRQNDVIRSMFPVITHLDRDIERGTGVTELLSTVGAGAGTVYPETATVGTMKNDNAGMFVGEMVEQIEGETNGLKRMFQIMMDIEREYLTPDIWVALAGEEGARWKGVSIDTVAQSLDFQLIGAAYAQNKRSQAEAYAAVFDRLMAVRQQDPAAIDIRELAKGLIKAFGVENDRIVRGEPRDLGPDAEHRTMRQGIPVMPEIDENIEQHMQAHMVEIQQVTDEGDGTPGEEVYVERLLEHIQETQKLMERVQQAQQMMQQQQQQQQPAGPQQGQPAEPGNEVANA